MLYARVRLHSVLVSEVISHKLLPWLRDTADTLDQSELTLLYNLCNVHTQMIGDIILLWKSVKVKNDEPVCTNAFVAVLFGSHSPPLLSASMYLIKVYSFYLVNWSGSYSSEEWWINSPLMHDVLSESDEFHGVIRRSERGKSLHDFHKSSVVRPSEAVQSFTEKHTAHTAALPCRDSDMRSITVDSHSLWYHVLSPMRWVEELYWASAGTRTLQDWC